MDLKGANLVDDLQILTVTNLQILTVSSKFLKKFVVFKPESCRDLMFGEMFVPRVLVLTGFNCKLAKRI